MSSERIVPGMKTVDAGWGGIDGFKQKQVELTITDECEWGGRRGLRITSGFWLRQLGPLNAIHRDNRGRRAAGLGRK